jgi:hypothetical protein
MTSKKTSVIRIGLGLLGLAAAAGTAPADDFNPNVTVRGFVSQGFLKSSANNFIAVPTKDGSFAFTEAALNFSAQPLPRLRVAAQVFARDVGAQGNNRAVLDWALGEYRPWDELGVRVGRIKFPVGLYNTLADADVTRPEIFQPGGLYPPERRDLTSAMEGGGIFGTLNLHRAGYLEYEGLYGTVDLDETYLLSRVGDLAANGLAPALSALPLSGVTYTVTDTSGSAKRIWGAHVEWHPPVSGLRLRVGMQGANPVFSTFAIFNGFAGPVPLSLGVRSVQAFDIPHQVVYSAEYSRGGLRVSAEHARQETNGTTKISGLPFPVPTSTSHALPVSTYGQVAYRFNEHLLLGSYYSVYYPDRQDKEGALLVRRGQPASGAWLKDLTFTLRVDVNAHWLAKVEVHHFDGTANLSRAENPTGVDKDWTLVAVKTTLHF